MIKNNSWPLPRLEVFTILPPGREVEVWNQLDDLECRVLWNLADHPGRENSIHMPDLALLCGCHTRELQDVIKSLVENRGLRIGGLKDGYFIITTTAEARAVSDNLWHRGLSNLVHAARVRGLTRAQFAAELDAEIGQLRLWE